MASNAIVRIPEPAIFLSASVPVKGRGDYIQTASPARIREAILALVSKVLDRFNLVFGGHPAITPLIWNSASALSKEKKVFIFQSKWFEDEILDEARRFMKHNNFVWTPKGKSLKESLRIFREWMLNPEKDYAPHYEYAVFIGGMKGVEDEYKIIRQYQPKVKIMPVPSTGGAALKLIQRDELSFKEMLIDEKNYRKVFRFLSA